MAVELVRPIVQNTSMPTNCLPICAAQNESKHAIDSVLANRKNAMEDIVGRLQGTEMVE